MGPSLTMAQTPGVHQLMGVDASDGAAGDVAHIVHPAHDAAETALHQASHDCVSVLQLHAPKLDIGAGGDVGAAISAVLGDAVAQEAQLLGRELPVGDLHGRQGGLEGA